MILRAAPLLAALDDGARSGLLRAAELLARRARAALDRPGPAPSRPGQPPRRQSGRGQAALHAASLPGRRAALLGLHPAGTHLARLERGTLRVAPRPWLAPTLRAERQRLAQEILAALRRSLP
jgi:hypothetical protein